MDGWMSSSSKRSGATNATSLGLAAGSESPARGMGAEAERELLPHFPVVVSHDVAWVGVHADQVVDHDVDAGLLLDLAHDGHGDGLARVDPSPGQRPQVVVGLVNQEQFAHVVVALPRHRPAAFRVGKHLRYDPDVVRRWLVDECTGAA